MGLHLYSFHHAEHGLDAVERVAPAAPGLARRLLGGCPAIRGAVVLATCNRFELYVDADAAAHPEVPTVVRAAIAGALPEPCCPTSLTLRERHGTQVLWHLFEVGAGLDSMVVGEREIAGQLRRALRVAHDDGTAGHLLTESIEQALRTSRRVAHLTGLAAHGRSVVSVGLDLLGRDWADTRVLLLGTGAYAGAVVAALHGRGCEDVTVHSASGRAAAFAATHGVRAAGGSLVEALADADAVVTCRGVGHPALTEDVVRAALADRPGRGLDVLDLALARDVEGSVGDLPGVRLLDLATLQGRVPDASAAAVTRAERLVAQGVEDLLVRLKGRQLDPVVVALRDNVAAMVDDEIDRLPSGRPLTPDEAAHALRRLAARLLHEPSVRARRAAEQGRGASYLAALHEVHGFAPVGADGRGHPPTGETAGRPVVDPETLDHERCPVAGYDLSDLSDRDAVGRGRREAM